MEDKENARTNEPEPGTEPGTGIERRSFYESLLGDSGYDDRDSGPATEPAKRTRGTRGTGNPGGESAGTGTRTRTRKTGSGTATGTDKETGSVGAKFTVEDNPPKEPKPEPETKPTPKPKPKPNPRAKKRGPVTEAHVEGWTVQLFSIAAMIRGAHWAVHSPEVEVKPWAGNAADLINEHVDADLAEKALALNAGVAVAVGVASMVMVRMQMDYELRRQMIAEQTAKQRRPGTGHPQEVGTPIRTVANEEVQPTPIRRQETGTVGGAAPTRPDEPLTGLGLQTAGLS